jgi:hypothetical protein
MPTLESIGYDEQLHNVMVEHVKRRALPDLEDIIKALAIGYVNLYNLTHPSNINAGLCSAFAGDVRYLFPDCCVAWDDELDDDRREGSHCVVIYEGRYFDSECAEGTDDLDGLPYFQRLSELQNWFDPDDCEVDNPRR